MCLKSARGGRGPPNKVLIAGTGVESAIETLRLTEYAAELGYDVAMVRTPHYYKKQMQAANILAFLPHRGRSFDVAGDYLQLSAGYRL